MAEGLQAQIRNARAAGAGEYDFTGPKGERYRWIDLYDEGRGAIVRLSLTAECELPNIEFGTLVDVWCAIAADEKIARGEERDRVFKGIKLRAVNIALAKIQAVPKAA